MPNIQKKIHIIGIEGAGTSALARMYKNLGYDVSGSDEGDHFYFDMLKDKKIEVAHKFSEKNIPVDVDFIVYSTAFKPETNTELKAAIASGKKIMTYAEALGGLFREKFGIAVCGTHGKTTTSAWLAFVLEKSGYSPNAIIGSKVPQFNGSTLVGDSDYFIIEADEYQNKLKYYEPRAVLLNNIEYDHPDFFPAMSDYTSAFIEFIKRIPIKGFLVANLDDPVIRKIALVNCRGLVITYGIDEAADYIAYDIQQSEGKQYFKVKFGVDDMTIEDEYDVEDELGDFCVSLPGKHNISNALAVITAAIELDVNLASIRTYLEEFTGAARRTQVMGKFKGAVIIDDYAHHPTAVRATLGALRKMHKDKKIIAVFQPHSFTRTKALLDDFAGSFDNADEVIILDIYGSARENTGDVHSRDIVEQSKHKNIKHISTLEECEEYLRKNIGGKDAAILMGAGDVYKIGEKILKDK